MKTYFIGLGGCGLQTVASLSTRLKKDPNYNPDDYAFTYVDTDMFTYSRINSDSIVIPAADFVDMGPTVPLAIYNGAKTTDRPNTNTKRLLEWAIEQKPGHMVLPNHPLSDGATAQRNVGRFGIYNFYEAMERELTTKINRFRELTPDDNGRRDVDIWVIASSCGGTGSSMTLDVLYMINRLAHDVANGEPNVKLVLYMPQTFVDLNSTNPNHKLNGYSCMEEINFFRFNFENGNGKSFEPYAVRPTAAGKEIYDFPLYQFLIPVCAENNFGSKMKVEQFYPTIAEMIYYLNTGNGRAFVKSNLSNILAELLLKRDASSGITSQMVGYGFRAIKKANKELKEYLTRRALYEVINYGLLDQRRPSDFDQQKVDFAQNAILKKLFSLSETVLDSDVTYRYNTTADADALENQIYSAVNNATKYDPNEVSSDVVRAISLKLDRLYTTENYEEQKKAVYAMITGEIDKRVNEFILMNGLNNTYDLLNFVDDFYLEPLCRYIVSTLLPDATGKVNAAKAACATYSKGGLLMALKKAEMNQALKKYKDAVARAITLTIAVQIIRELTESPSGYLEKLRKGDNTNYAGIRNLQKLLESDGTDYKDMYATLAKEFRATEDDIMTVYLPSLAELATGEDNTDWADNNSFDQLYCESVIAQQDITRGLEKIRVPMRTSASGKGLKDIISRIDPDNNLFINSIKSKQISLPTNKETLIIKPIKHVIDTIVNDKSTSAGRWMSEELSEAIKDPRLLPKAFKRTDDLFNSFKNTSRVPVFFPLRSDVSVPDNMRLMFVGNNEGLAGDLGYNPNSKVQQFIHDSSMSDRFMVMCMPAGFEFNMYKYYQSYKTFYMSDPYLERVRGQFYGCHIHAAFNKYGLTLPKSEHSSTAPKESLTEQLASRRIESLVKSLYFQHVINLLWEKDKSAYNNLFGLSGSAAEVDTTGMTPEMLQLLGMEIAPAASAGEVNQFITLQFDPKSISVHLQLRPVTVNPKTKYLEIDNSGVQNFEFDKDHTQQCKAFVEYLMTIPESLFAVADYLEQKFDIRTNEQMNSSLMGVRDEAKMRLLKSIEGGAATFAFCWLLWKKHNNSEDKAFIEVIDQAINSL